MGWLGFVGGLLLAESAIAGPLFQQVDVFVSGRDGYFAYRIPAIETAPNGTLLAFAEARKYNLDDPGFNKQDIDLVLKRSTNNGQTWSVMQIIEDPGEGWSAANPSTVVDRDTQRLWLFYLRGKPGRNTYTARPGTDDIQIFARHSGDQGVTWSEPLDLTSATRDLSDPKWRTTVAGPGGGIQSQDGRLAIPLWRFEPWSVFTVVSDDHGRTWRRGGFVPEVAGDECQLVELADGHWLMDIRQQRGPHRWRSSSNDGGRTWSAPHAGEQVSAVACAIERYTRKGSGDDHDRLLWTGPKGPGRSNLVVRVSYDEGQTFPHERSLSAGQAAYSDLAILRDQSAGVLWERGTDQGYQFITFTRFNREWLEPSPENQGARPSARQKAQADPLRQPSQLRLATFSADVTVPLGHGMMGGAWLSKNIDDPLEAHGLVLLGGEAPVVLVAVDWCEIRNDAYARWQTVLAEAADTQPDHVLVTAVHQHDAPVADLAAEGLLRSRRLAGTICDPVFHERAVQSVAKALRESLQSARPFTHVGMGQAKVEQLASNRRYLTPDGAVHFDRTSSTRHRAAIEADAGLIDPWLKTLSFWDGDAPLVAVSFYAVHPMSYYGQGEVSADFPGLARRKRQAELPGVKQIYCSGCSGNVTAGKYNDGTRPNRAVLADRLHSAMVAAWQNTRRQAVDRFDFCVTPLRLEPRSSAGFSVTELEAQLTPSTKPFQQCLAAMGLSWRQRVDAGRAIQIPALDFGIAQLLLLPGESYVEYQLAAQRLRPDSFVCVAGFGDGATGYVPTEKHFAEKDTNLGDWCWVAPGCEARLFEAIRTVLTDNPMRSGR